jgi:hypothetical protein
MLSLVSSEHVFSQGRITILKCCSCLKNDIVEALQCVKSMIRHDLLFQEPVPSSKVEAEKMGHQELEDAGTQGNSRGQPVREESDVKDDLWDGLLIKDEDDEPMYYSE